MELCEKYGSLSKAYKEMGMSNSKAWKIIKRAQEDLGYELVHTTSGGSLGGGSQLTLEGKNWYVNINCFKKNRNVFRTSV